MKSKAFIISSLVTIMLFAFIITATTLFSQSIRLDESQSLWESTKPVLTIIHLTGEDVHVPLYGVLLHFWIQIFGTTIVSARILSFIFFLASIPILYILYAEASDKKISLLSVLAFSVSPFVLWYSSESRMYTLFILVASINNLYFLRFLRSKGRHGKAGYVISTVFGFYTHYFYFFSLATQGIFLIGKTLVDYYKKPSSKVKEVKRFFTTPFDLLITFILLAVGALTAFVPWAVYVVHLGLAANIQPLIPAPTTFNIFQTFVYFIFGFQAETIQATFISLWPLLILIFFFMFTQKKRIITYKIDYFLISAFFPIALVYLLSFIKPIFLSRYLIFTTPSLFFLVMWSFMGYSKKIATILSSSFIVLLLGLLLLQNFSHLTPVKEDYSGAGKYLTKNATPSDVIAVTAPFTIYPVEYTYNGYSRITTIPEWNRYTGGIPPFTGNKLQTEIKGFTTQYNRLFVVYSYDQGYENKIKTYLGGHFTTLKIIPFSSGLEIRVYKMRY